MKVIIGKELLCNIKGNRLPQWFSGEESACSSGASGDAGSIPESGRSPGGGHGNPLQYSCLDNSMDRGTWLTVVHRVTKRRNCSDYLPTHIKGNSVKCRRCY